MISRIILGFAAILFLSSAHAQTTRIAQEPNTWVKRSPVAGAPTSPGLGYETTLAYDPLAKRIIRWSGHNQGGGGEQNAETWTLDPLTWKWELKEPNTSPPGVCCGQQNLFDPVGGRFLRFPSFAGSHGWQWFREIYLSDSSLWTYDLATNTWRDMRPLPRSRSSPLRCASWDSDHQVAVVFGGEGNSEGTRIYDPYTNTWTWPKPKPHPEGRSGGNMVYDAKNKLHILFGSQFSDDPHTWAYDIRKNEWRDMKPAVQPSTNRNDAVMAYDSANGVVIAVVRVWDSGKPDGEGATGHVETWAYNAETNVWRKMSPPKEPPGFGSRRRCMIYLPDQNLVVMENRGASDAQPNREVEQQIWTYRYGPVADSRHPGTAAEFYVEVTQPQLTMDGNSVMLKWQPIKGAAGYQVLRAQSDAPWRCAFEPIATLDKSAESFRDTKVERGKTYFYIVRLGITDAQGQPTYWIWGDEVVLRTQPRVVEEAIVSVISPTEVRLSWTPPRCGQAVGYFIERAPVEVWSEDQVLRLKKELTPLAQPSVGAIRRIGEFVRLNEKPIAEGAYTDTKIDLSNPTRVEKGETISDFRADAVDPAGKPYRFGVYAYRIRAINALGVESGPSPFSLTIPSSPKHVFSKEEGQTLQLKWAGNPEMALRGYRVYRMHDWIKATRITDEPIAATTFTHESAGAKTARYHIVAVDAIGQEGIPSAPVWANREWKRYYLPFTGEWHQ